jgi:CRP/FNR family cyclic AMP-dependent transcriptional regulator
LIAFLNGSRWNFLIVDPRRRRVDTQTKLNGEARMATHTSMDEASTLAGPAIREDAFGAQGYDSGPIGSSMLRARRPAFPRGALRTVRPEATPVEALDLRGLFELKAFSTGAVIVPSKGSADHSFLVKSGRVRITRSAASRTQSLVSILHAGELFGDPLKPETGPGDQTAVASGETEVWLLNTRDLRGQIRARPDVAEFLLDCYAERTQRFLQQLRVLASKDVAARLAETILTMARAHGQRCSHGFDLEIQDVTQQDLADLIGASRSLVSTRVADMKRKGVLERHGRALCVTDPSALQRIARGSSGGARA